MPEKDGSLGLGGLSSALGNGTPAFHRSSSSAMITTGSGRISDNPAAMSTTGDGSRAIQGGTRGARGGTTATANAAMRANRRNGNLTNSGALRAANGFATVAAKLETAINRQSAMIEKQTNQIISRLDMLNKTAATMSEMFQKANAVAIKTYDESMKKTTTNWLAALIPSIYRTNMEMLKRFSTTKIDREKIFDAWLDKITNNNKFGDFFKRLFNYNTRVFNQDKKVVPWTRENSVALVHTIPNAIAQLDKNLRAISTLTVIKFDKANTILEEQLVEEYRHNTRNEELLTDIATKFTAYFKTSSGQREAIGLSANHIQNAADHFYLNSNVHRGKLIKELNGMTNHIVDQFTEIMDNAAEQLSGAASYIIKEMESMLNSMAAKLIPGSDDVDYNRSEFKSAAMDRTRIKTYTSKKTPKPTFKSIKPDNRLTNWITSFYRTDANRVRDFNALMKKMSSQMNVGKDASVAEFSKAFAKAFNINNANAQPIQNMLALMAPKGKGRNATGEDIAANLLASIGFGSDIYDNPEFQKRLLEKLGVKYNANRSTHISTVSRALQNKLKKSDITVDDLMTVIGGNAKNAQDLFGNIATGIGIKEQGRGFRNFMSKSLFNKGEKKNNQQNELDRKAKESLIRLGGLDKKKSKGASIEDLEKQIEGGIKAIDTSSSVTKNQIKTSTLMIKSLQSIATSLLAPRNLFSLATTALKFFTLFRGASMLFGGMRWVKNNPIFKTIGGYIYDWIWKPVKKHLIDPLVSGVKSLMVKYIPPETMDKISKVTDSVVGFVSKWGGIASTAMLSDDPQERRAARNKIVSGIGSVFSTALKKYVVPVLWKIVGAITLMHTLVSFVKSSFAKAIEGAKTFVKTRTSNVWGKMAPKSGVSFVAGNGWSNFGSFSYNNGTWTNNNGFGVPVGSGVTITPPTSTADPTSAPVSTKPSLISRFFSSPRFAPGTRLGNMVGSTKDFLNGAGINSTKDFMKFFETVALGSYQMVDPIGGSVLRYIIVPTIKKLFTTVSSVFSKLQPIMTKAWNWLKPIMTKAWDGLKPIMTRVWDGLKPIMTNAWGKITPIANNAWGAIKKSGLSVWSSISKLFGFNLNSASGIVNGVSHATSAFSGISGIMGNATSKVKNMYGKAASFVKNNAVTKAVSGFATGAIKSVSTFVGGAFKSIGASTLTSFAGSMLGSIGTFLGGALSLVNPVGLAIAAAGLGVWLVKKISGSIKSSVEKNAVDTRDSRGVGAAIYNSVSDSISGFFHKTAHMFDRFGGWTGLVKSMFTGFAGAIGGIWGGIAKAVGSQSKNPISVFGHLVKNVITGIGGLIKDIFSLIGSGIMTSINTLYEIAKDSCNWIIHTISGGLFGKSAEELNEEKADKWYRESVIDLFENREDLKIALERRANGDKAIMNDFSVMEDILGSYQINKIKEASKSKENRDIASTYRYFEYHEKEVAAREAKRRAEEAGNEDEEDKEEDSFRDKVSSALNSIKDYFDTGKFMKDIGTLTNKLGGFLKDTFNSLKNFDYKGVGNSIIEGAGGLAGNLMSGLLGESEAFDLFTKLEDIGAERGYTALTAFAGKAKHTIASDITDIARFTGGSQNRLEEIRNVLRDGIANGWGTTEQMIELMAAYERGESARSIQSKKKSSSSSNENTNTTSTTNTTKTVSASTSSRGSTTKTESPSSTSGSVSTASSSKSSEDRSFWDKFKNLFSSEYSVKYESGSSTDSSTSDSSSTLKGSGGLVGATKRALGINTTTGKGNVSGNNIKPVKTGGITVGQGNFASGTVYAAGLIIPSKFKSKVKLSGTYGEIIEGGETNAGIDIAHYPATGAVPSIIAPVAGIVKYVGALSDYGRTVLLTHYINGQEYTTLYGHLDSFAKGLKVGDSIAAGELIGYMGTSGSNDYDGKSVSDGVYPRRLHFSVAKGKNPALNYSGSVDPVSFLNLVHTVRNTKGSTTVSAGEGLVGYETAEYTAKKPPKYGLAAIGDRGTETATGFESRITGQIIKSATTETPESELDKNIEAIFQTKYFKDMNDEQKVEAYNKIINDPEMLKLAMDYDMHLTDPGANWFQRMFPGPFRGLKVGFTKLLQPLRAKEISNLLKPKEDKKELNPELRHLRDMLGEAGLRNFDKYIDVAMGSDAIMSLVKSSLEKWNKSEYGFGEYAVESKNLVKAIEEEETINKGMEKIFGTRVFDKLPKDLRERFKEYAQTDSKMREVSAKVGKRFNLYGRTRGADYMNELGVLADIRRAKDEADRNKKPEYYNDAIIAHMLRLGGGVSEEELPELIEIAKGDKSVMASVEDLKTQIESGKEFNEGEVRSVGSSIFKQIEDARLEKMRYTNAKNTLITGDYFKFLGDSGIKNLSDLLDTDEVAKETVMKYINQPSFWRGTARKEILDRLFMLGLEKYKNEDHPARTETLDDDTKAYLKTIFKTGGGLTDEEAEEQIKLLSGSATAVEKAKSLATNRGNKDSSHSKTSTSLAFKELTELMENDKQAEKLFYDNIPIVFASPRFKDVKEDDKPLLTEMLWRNDTARNAIININPSKKISDDVVDTIKQATSSFLTEDKKLTDTTTTAEAAEDAANGKEGKGSTTSTSAKEAAIPMDVKYTNALTELLGDRLTIENIPKALNTLRTSKVAMGLLDDYISKSEATEGGLDEKTKESYSKRIYSSLTSLMRLNEKSGVGEKISFIQKPVATPKSEKITGTVETIDSTEKTQYDPILTSAKFLAFDKKLASIVGLDSYKKLNDNLKKELYNDPSVYRLVNSFSADNEITKNDIVLAAESSGIHMSTVFDDPETQQLMEMVRRSREVQDVVTDQAQLSVAEQTKDLTKTYGEILNGSILDGNNIAKLSTLVGASNMATMQDIKNVFVLLNNTANNNLMGIDNGGGAGGAASGGGGLGGRRALAN